MSVSRQILIVEDEKGIRSAITRALELRGHRSFSAENLAQALEVCKNEAIEIVVTDLRLENGDGVQIVQKLCELRPNLRPIFMTGYGSLETAIDAVRLNAIDYLIKPFRLETLIAAIDRFTPNAEASTSSMKLPYRKSFVVSPETIEESLEEIELALRRAKLDTDSKNDFLEALGEIFKNAAKHAYPNSSGSVRVAIKKEGNELQAEISDSGRGFDASKGIPEFLTKNSGELGGIRRVQQLVGDFKIQSAPGKGCSVRLYAAFTKTNSFERQENLIRQALWS